MTEVESKQAFDNAPLKPIKKNLSSYKLGLNNIIYQVSLAKDGNSWCALIGHNLQDGICGFGDTAQEALHNLANKIEE
jgi:hypothetical protein